MSYYPVMTSESLERFFKSVTPIEIEYVTDFRAPSEKIIQQREKITSEEISKKKPLSQINAKNLEIPERKSPIPLECITDFEKTLSKYFHKETFTSCTGKTLKNREILHLCNLMICLIGSHYRNHAFQDNQIELTLKQPRKVSFYLPDRDRELMERPEKIELTIGRSRKGQPSLLFVDPIHAQSQSEPISKSLPPETLIQFLEIPEKIRFKIVEERLKFEEGFAPSFDGLKWRSIGIYSHDCFCDYLFLFGDELLRTAIPTHHFKENFL